MKKFNFEPFPILETERLNLLRLSLQDESEVFAIRSNEKVATYLARPLAKSVEDVRNFINKIDEGINSNQWIYWKIAFKESTRFIGSICLWNMDKDNSKTEIGFEILPEYEGKGIMREAVIKVLDYGFNVLEFERIEGEVDPQNLRSIHMLEKNGFVLERPITENDETVIYKLDKTTFNERNEGTFIW